MTEDLWFSVATIVAVVVGPVLAVVVTRFIDDKRAEKARQLEIFRTLMRTRGTPIHVEHVGALNLVEIEFANNAKVISAWKNYLSNLGEPLPDFNDKARFDQALKVRDNLLTKLIHEISVVLKFKIEQLDILEGNYVPQGWNDLDWEQRLVRRHLIDVLSGKTAIAVRPPNIDQPNSPYPPPPSAFPNPTGQRQNDD